MAYNNKGYNKTTYKKADTPKESYKPKGGNTDGSGLMVNGSWFTVHGSFRFKAILVHG